MKPIRIVIADDHAVVRTGLSALLEMERDMMPVGEAADGISAINITRKTSPDVVIMDSVMPIMNGVKATAAIKSEMPSVKVLLLTSYASADEINQALKAGASGAILKSAPNDKLIAVIRSIFSGEKYLDPEIDRQMKDVSARNELTSRQQEILASVTNGLTNYAIAQKLNITPDCIKGHMTAIFKKLGVSSRAEAVAIAFKRHLLKI